VRVCFATYPTAFQEPGGGERVLDQLAAALERRDVEVTRFDQWSTRLGDFDVLHYFSSYGSDLFPLLRRHVNRLAVTPFIWPELPPLISALRRLRHAAAPVLGPAPAPYDAVDLIFPTSHREAELLVRNYSVLAERIAIVPHGADLRFAAEPSGEFARVNGLGRYILCPGRIDPNKNQLRVIHALADEDVDLVILGDVAAGEEAYGGACRRAAGPRTHFLPSLPPGSDLLIDAVAGAACVVIASVYELCSLSALEAGVAGVPIASTTGGGMFEHLAPWASFFDPRSEHELRRAVIQSTGKGRSRLQSIEFAERFSWESVAEQTLAAYRQTG
jgi:glycosyltransferase involved in cell wall biosynthesis